VPKLVIFRGDAVESEVHLAGPTLRIGRDSGNDIVLDDKSVSRFHAEVRSEAATYFIVDLKSRNGLWLNGQQIKGKAALALGVPVTLGAYELALEDDVSTGEFGEEAPPVSQRTVASAASGDEPRGPSRSATQRWSTQSPAADATRTALFWSGLVVTTLLLCGITYGIIRYRDRPQTIAEVVTPPPFPPSPAPLPGLRPTEDRTREAIDQHMAAARTAMESHDYVTALRDHLAPVLELDPGNQEVLDLKRQADEAVSQARTKQVVTKPEPPPGDVDTPGIPRRTGETPAEYSARVQRISVNFQEGTRSLERQDFALAIARFQLVDRDQKGYRGVDAMITDAIAKQHQAVDEAIDSGQKNEQAGKLPEALRWYERAQIVDPTSAKAREKYSGLADRLIRDGLKAFNTAEVLRKRSEYAKAIVSYKQAAELLPRGHEKIQEAQKWLEILKP